MIDTKESCFAVEDSIDGQYFALEFEEVGERAQEHLQSVWQRLNLALDSHAKKEELAAPNWLSWSPWKWTTDKREAYAERRSPGRLGEDFRQEPPVPRCEQRSRSIREDQVKPRETRGLLAHAGKRQELFHGVLFAEGSSQSTWKLDVRRHY